jgi:hypothetical protein
MLVRLRVAVSLKARAAAAASPAKREGQIVEEKDCLTADSLAQRFLTVFWFLFWARQGFGCGFFIVGGRPSRSFAFKW